MAQDIRLKKGQKIKLMDNRTVTVTDKIGQGGQGIVYKVRIDATREERALKWYFPDSMEDQNKFYENIRQNIQNGAPSPAFAWPEQMTERMNGTFGYIMQLFPKEYVEFTRFLMAKASFKNTAAIVDAAINIVTAFMKLHDAGYNYQDINDGSFAFDPQTGNALICDTDNISGHGYYSGVLGKERYMAPEVVRGETMPNKVTDRFSLAVILFLLLVGDHPLEGAMTNVPVLTNKYEKRFFGEKPLFIFDEYDSSNMPIQGKNINALRMWPYFPAYIQKAFRRSFSQESLLKAEGRLLEKQWMHLLARLKSSIVKCPHCGDEIFLESSGQTLCSNCRGRIRPAGYLDFTKRRGNIPVRIPVYEGAVLYACHIDESSEDYHTEAARVIVKPDKYGLENLSGNKWIVTIGDRTSVRDPGSVVVLTEGMHIDFGGGTAADVAPG